MFFAFRLSAFLCLLFYFFVLFQFLKEWNARKENRLKGYNCSPHYLLLAALDYFSSAAVVVETATADAAIDSSLC